MKFHVRILKIRSNWISNFPSRLLFFVFHRRKWLVNILKAHDDDGEEEEVEENVVIVEARSDWHKFQFVATNSLFHDMQGVSERWGLSVDEGSNNINTSEIDLWILREANWGNEEELRTRWWHARLEINKKERISQIFAIKHMRKRSKKKNQSVTTDEDEISWVNKFSRRRFFCAFSCKSSSMEKETERNVVEGKQKRERVNPFGNVFD